MARRPGCGIRSRAAKILKWQLEGRPRMSELSYEQQTGNKATYRKDSSDYHTLEYVRWLEAELAEARDKIAVLVEHNENTKRVEELEAEIQARRQSNGR